MHIILSVLILYDIMSPSLCKLRAKLQFECRTVLSCLLTVKKREVPHTKVSQPQNAGMYDPREAIFQHKGQVPHSQRKTSPALQAGNPPIHPPIHPSIHPPTNPSTYSHPDTGESNLQQELVVLL